MEKKEKKDIDILEVLSNSDTPLSGNQITEILNDQGDDISERTVRLYLKRLDDEGYTKAIGKRGRIITEKGTGLLESKQLIQRVGYMSSKIDKATYVMSFDLALRRGTVVINVALVGKEVFKSRLGDICSVFHNGYAMGSLVNILHPGDKVGNIVIPPGKIGFCTVCSVTLNGVLLKHGVPTRSIFSGLLELENGKASRFVDIINYDGTSIDPLQLFIRSRMTNYLGAIRNGNGKIGAGFREIPEESYNLVRSLAEKLDAIGLGAFLKIGQPSKDLLNIPVRQGCCGIIVIGGLNPVAILEETGAEVQHFALSGFMEYNDLFSYSEMKDRM